MLNNFFKFFFCVYHLLTIICYFEYVHDSIINHNWKISSGLFSSLLTASQNQLQYCTVSTQSASWRFCTAIKCMVSNEAILWLHVQMTFYTQSRITCLNFLNLWFMIVFHTTCFCRLYKMFCFVVLLDDCMQIQSDIDSVQGWLLLILFISRAAKLEAVTYPGRQTLFSLNTTW